MKKTKIDLAVRVVLWPFYIFFAVGAVFFTLWFVVKCIQFWVWVFGVSLA